MGHFVWLPESKQWINLALAFEVKFFDGPGAGTHVYFAGVPAEDADGAPTAGFVSIPLHNRPDTKALFAALKKLTIFTGVGDPAPDGSNIQLAPAGATKSDDVTAEALDACQRCLTILLLNLDSGCASNSERYEIDRLRELLAKAGRPAM